MSNDKNEKINQWQKENQNKKKLKEWKWNLK
jgi:hypothetical protein